MFKCVLGNQRIDSYAANTVLGKQRAIGQIKSAPVSKTLLEKVSKTVSMKKQTVLKKQAKKAKKKMKKKPSQMKLTSFWGKPKPKPKPSSN